MKKTKKRKSPIEISKDEFQQIGYDLVERISQFIKTIRDRQVTTGEHPKKIQSILGTENLPEEGRDLDKIFDRATDLLFNHSLFNGHPKFFGYITSSPTQSGMLAELLAAAVNANAGANILSPMATAIEKQTIRWLSEFIGLPTTYGGIIVSGGNMANFTAFLAARTAKAPKTFKEEGLSNTHPELLIYCSKATHTWIEKAAVLFGHGTRALRWIDTGSDQKINTELLSATIRSDIEAGKKPFLVIGNAGDVSTGVVDDLSAIAVICKEYDLWFHIDGAYGIPAAVVPEFQHLFTGILDADSIAMDPHKWLYAPLEAGCTLVKNPQHLLDTYSAHPVYYNFSSHDDEPILNFYEYGLQNSRGFKALKVWIALQQVGRKGYIEMISEDIRLSKLLFELARTNPELEAVTQYLSIATFRFIPRVSKHGKKITEEALNKLNEDLLNVLQDGGKVFLSNAVIEGKYCLRACIVNYRSSEKDIHETIDIIISAGRKLAAKLKDPVSA